MTRPIKFRAWDKVDKRFLDENDNVPNFLALIPCDSTGEFIPMYMEIAETKIYETDIVVMQFTGLHDKNGKEIYESDQVETPAGVGTVEWKDGCYWLVWPKGGKTTLHDVRLSHREVIGNKFEHPELLEESKS